MVDHAGHQRVEGRAVGTGQVRDEPRVGLEQHRGVAMPQLPRDPLGVFTGGQPERGAGVARLVRAAGGEAEMAEQGIPDAVGEVVVVQGRAVGIAEDE